MFVGMSGLSIFYEESRTMQDVAEKAGNSQPMAMSALCLFPAPCRIAPGTATDLGLRPGEASWKDNPPGAGGL